MDIAAVLVCRRAGAEANMSDLTGQALWRRFDQADTRRGSFDRTVEMTGLECRSRIRKCRFRHGSLNRP